MKITLLNRSARTYTSNAYLVLGSWNRLDDLNTLIDTGNDGSIVNEIESTYTGVGKKKIDQIILTHNHFDHTGNLRTLKETYAAKVYAFSDSKDVDELLEDGQIVRIGDRDFEVIHVPYHSSDSICLFCDHEKILFSGDTPLKIISASGSYTGEFIKTIEMLQARNIQTVYFGHDIPMKKGVKEMLELTLENIKTAKKLMN